MKTENNSTFPKILTRALYKIDGFDVRKTVKLESDLKKDLNLNDVDIVQIMMDLEHKYNIHMSYDYNKPVYTVDDLRKKFYLALSTKTNDIRKNPILRTKANERY